MILQTNCPLEFWFEFGSTYSYPCMMRIEELAKQYAVPVVYKPFLLGPVFRDLGMTASPFILNPVKGAYMWRDMERLCSQYGLAWTKPTVFPRLGLLPLRIILAAEGQGWVPEFCRRVMHLNFGLDQDINHPDVLTEILLELEQPAMDLIAHANSDVIKSSLRTQTEFAKEKGVFGAPTFFVGSEMFWGNDRLEDALVYASSQINSTSV